MSRTSDFCSAEQAKFLLLLLLFIHGGRENISRQNYADYYTKDKKCDKNYFLYVYFLKKILYIPLSISKIPTVPRLYSSTSTVGLSKPIIYGTGASKKFSKLGGKIGTYT